MTQKEYRLIVNELCESMLTYIDRRKNVDVMLSNPQTLNPPWLFALADELDKVRSAETEIRSNAGKVLSAPLKLKA